MGALFGPDSPCGSHEPIIVNTEVKREEWAEAVTKNKFAGVRMLHDADYDPNLINQPVDGTNGVALHYAVINKNDEMLKYLLKHGADVKVQGGAMYQSALHYAAEGQNWKAVELLIRHDDDQKLEELKNNDRKTAVELIYGDIPPEKEKKRAKVLKDWNRAHKKGTVSREKGLSDDDLDEKEPEPVMVAQMKIFLDHDPKAKKRPKGETPKATIRMYVKENNQATKLMKAKNDAISQREVAVTRFGEDTGIDPDEIAVVIQGLPDLEKVWQKCTKGADTQEVYKQTEIYKILYSLTVLTLRKKSTKSRKPPPEAVKKLTIKFSRMLPKKKGRHVLDKQYFCTEFYRTLYELHEELVLQYEEEKLGLAPL